MKKIIRGGVLISLSVLLFSCKGNLNPYQERNGYNLFGFVEGSTTYNQKTDQNTGIFGGFIPLVYGGFNAEADTMVVAARVAPTSKKDPACDIQTVQIRIPVSKIVVGREFSVPAENQALNVQYTISGEKQIVNLSAESGTILFERFEMLEKRSVDNYPGPYLSARATFDLSFTLSYSDGTERKIHLTKGVFDVVRPTRMDEFERRFNQ